MSLNTDARHAVVQRERHICPTCRGTGEVCEMPVAMIGWEPRESWMTPCPTCRPQPVSGGSGDGREYEPFDVAGFEL